MTRSQKNIKGPWILLSGVIIGASPMYGLYESGGEFASIALVLGGVLVILGAAFFPWQFGGDNN